MKLQGRDLKKLRWQLGAFLGLVAIAVLIAGQSRDLEKKSVTELAATTARHRQSELRLQQVRTEEQEIKEKSALFLQLMSSGVIGQEKRLEWTELLRETQRQFRLPDMSYEFAPQTSLGNTGEADYNFYASPMKLHLQLLHEEDLLRFLAALQKQAKALVLVRSCILVRPPTTPGNGAPPYLGADCELEWTTVRGAGSGTARK